VIHAPPIKNRFWEFELLDPWTNNFYNITSIPQPLGPGDFGVTNGGNWAVIGPGFHGRIPFGVKVIHARYDRVWIAGPTFVRGASDVANVHRIQNQYSITPLSSFGKHVAHRPTRGHVKSITATIDATVKRAQIRRPAQRDPIAPASTHRPDAKPAQIARAEGRSSARRRRPMT
jgi:hypothetical protein